MKNILFIGLGNMGLPMALNLLKGGFKVEGYDLIDTAKQEFERAGGEWIDDLKNSKAPLIISMLPGSPEMEKLYLGDSGLFSFLEKNTRILDCSTADPLSVKNIFLKAKEKEIFFSSAPVSGGIAGAREGTLSFMFGGSREDLEALSPVLKAMGKVFHVGEVEQGQIAKICNNMLLAIHMVGTCEAFSLAKNMGLKEEVLNEIMKNSSGNNWSLEKYNPCPGLMAEVPSSKNYEGGFSVKLMLKDLNLAKNCIKASKTKALLGDKVFEIYETHFKEGFEKKDFSHIFTSISKNT